MDPKLLTAYLVAILLEIGMPVVAATVVGRKLGVSWRYFWYGALIFFLFQMISRVPAVQILQIVLAEQLRTSEAARWAWLFVLALTAGIFEEGGRFLGYRYLIFRGPRTLPISESPGAGTGTNAAATKPAARASAFSTQHSATTDWNRGVMYGLGHGGLESMLLVGGLAILGLINAVAILRIDPAAVPADQMDAFLRARAALESAPWWMPLLGAFERLCTITVQVGFSILVLQVFVRGSLRWLYLATAAHFAVDMISVIASPRIGPVATEGIIALFAVIALYTIFRLRPAAPPQLSRPADFSNPGNGV